VPEDKNIDTEENEIPAIGFISTRKYGDKYNIPSSTLSSWIKKGFLEARLRTSPKGRKSYTIFDVPPAKHPQYDSKQQLKVRTRTKHGNSPSPQTIENRKEKLKDKYLPLFVERAAADKMTFTGREVMDMLEVNSDRLYKIWPSWGLQVQSLPANNHIKRGRKNGSFKTTRYYTRSELYRFLSGDWDKKGFKSIDDMVTTDVMGGASTEDGYYIYKKPPWPLDGNGIVEWIKAVNLMILNRRTNRWEPLINSLRPDQIEFIVKAFTRVIVEGRGEEYAYRIVVISTPRGEGKTLLVAVMCLFRFFNLSGEVINLSGNSKDQASFAHYELAKRMILNTPLLVKTPGLVVKEKHIVLYKGHNDIVNEMKAIPTSTGLLPNTTCAVFTELHNLQDRSFFIDLWTSTRATVNAMVLVDTTVAPKGHIVYNLWESYCKNEDPHLYFHHYADVINNPETTQSQLDSFKNHMSEHEYNKYFRNRWEDASGGFFSAFEVRLIEYGGVRLDREAA